MTMQPLEKKPIGLKKPIQPIKNKMRSEDEAKRKSIIDRVKSVANAPQKASESLVKLKESIDSRISKLKGKNSR